MGPPYPTDDTVEFLTKRFTLPPYDNQMQDWPLEVSDGARLGEFCDAYEAGMPTENAQAALMELLLFSLETVFPYAFDGPPTRLVQMQAEQIVAWLDRDFTLYFYIIDYWRCGNDPDPEHGFSISPLIRRIWGERFATDEEPFSQIRPLLGK